MHEAEGKNMQLTSPCSLTYLLGRKWWTTEVSLCKTTGQ